MRYNLAALALVMLSFGVVLGADDKTYPIILHPPFKKGDLSRCTLSNGWATCRNR